MSQAFSMVSKVDPELQDRDWIFITYEVMMNYSVESLRHGYAEWKKKKEQYVESDALREAGYTEEDIANRTE